MKSEMPGLVLLLLLALYSFASVSWQKGANIFEAQNILLTGIMLSSTGGAGALLFYRWRMRANMEP